MIRLFQSIAGLVLFGALIGAWAGMVNAADRVDHTATDPTNETYLIGDMPVALVDGRCESPAAPGSAMKIRTEVWGQPVYGDLDGDGDSDGVLLLTHDPGGSGTFCYLAAAINTDGNYRGSEAVLLGDRIVPSQLRIISGVATVQFIDRQPDEPMSASPSVKQTSVFVFEGDRFIETARLVDQQDVYAGWVTIGHEVRSFKPCNSEQDFWLVGQSPAMNAIVENYRQMTSANKSYQPLLMILAGDRVAPPTHGFGADYQAALKVTHYVRIAPGMNCNCDKINFE
jgi:hypothetical protein